MRRRYAIISVVFIFIFTSTFTYLYAGREEPFIYRSEDRKDPFVPLVSKDGKLMIGFGVLDSINDVILEGIIYDPERESIVVLNGLILKENDRVGRIKVERIERDSVILSFENEEYTFKLKE